MSLACDKWLCFKIISGEQKSTGSNPTAEFGLRNQSEQLTDELVLRLNIPFFHSANSAYTSERPEKLRHPENDAI